MTITDAAHGAAVSAIVVMVSRITLRTPGGAEP